MLTFIFKRNVCVLRLGVEGLRDVKTSKSQAPSKSLESIKGSGAQTGIICCVGKYHLLPILHRPGIVSHFIEEHGKMEYYPLSRGGKQGLG